MTHAWNDVKGTVLIRPSEDMTYSDLKKIVKAITEITRVDGGYASSFTTGGDILFFHMSEKESDQLRSELIEIFGEEGFDKLEYAYDDDFGDGEE